MVKFEEVIEKLDSEAASVCGSSFGANEPDFYFSMLENFINKARTGTKEGNFEDVYLNLSKFVYLIEKLEKHPNILEKEYIQEYNFTRKKVALIKNELDCLKYKISEQYDGSFEKPYGYFMFSQRLEKIRKEDFPPPTPLSPSHKNIFPPKFPDSEDFVLVDSPKKKKKEKKRIEEVEGEKEKEEVEENGDCRVGVVAGVVDWIYGLWKSGGSGLSDFSSVVDD